MTPASSSPAAPNPILARLRRIPWGPWQLFWLALAVRLLAIALLRTYHLHPREDHFGFGYEIGRIARALATGRGYADPFQGHTGPTAWIAPVFPLILGGIFKLFGVYSQLSAIAILSFDCLLNALLVPILWETGARCFSPSAGRWSAWIWALYPAAMQFAVKWVWEMTLTAFLFQLAFLVALRVARVGSRPGDGPTWRRWLAFGLLWGLLALTNPAPLLFLPVCGFWMLFASGRGWPAHFPKALCAGLLFIAVVAPWSWRNQRVFHAPVPFRSNFGAELYLGNGPWANGLLLEYNHPNMNPLQLDLYHRMGELAYTRMRGQLATRIIRADLPLFLRNCLWRVDLFWFGVPDPAGHPFNSFFRDLNYSLASLSGLFGLALALRRKIPAARLMAAAFLLLPVAYYIVAAHARFRHPLEPLICLLAVYLFQQAQPRWGFTLPILRRLWPAHAAPASAVAS